jgi:hypothetical protein
MSEMEPIPPPEPEGPVTPEEPASANEAASAKAVSDNDAAVDREMARKARRSFFVGGIAALVGTGAWGWLTSRRLDDGVRWPLRIGLRINEQFWRDLTGHYRLARTFAPGDVESPRPNGSAGLDDDIDPDWKLTVDGIPDAEEPLSLTLAEIKALPKIEIITELKCIEGWSSVVKWGGARFQDFVAKYAPGQVNRDGYVALETPDRGYYVGLDLASAMHPQTLLCYEMNGAPLEDEHGAPLRLVIPVKYGIKNLKRIGRIAFSNSRPPDYWAERGYDYYAGF